MPRHLILPRGAFTDVQSLLRLDESRLRALGDLFSTPESISHRSPGFVRRVAERLGLDAATAGAVALVCHFLLTVTEEGQPPSEVLDDVREFVEQAAPPDDRETAAAIDAKRGALESLLTPKPERSRAQKVRYLSEVQPTAESFRTVCELRPVFDRAGGGEEIVGYVPVVLLEVRQAGPAGEESRLHFHMHPRMLKSLAEAVGRAEEKLAAIRREFGERLLGDGARE